MKIPCSGWSIPAAIAAVLAPLAAPRPALAGGHGHARGQAVQAVQMVQSAQAVQVVPVPTPYVAATQAGGHHLFGHGHHARASTVQGVAVQGLAVQSVAVHAVSVPSTTIFLVSSPAPMVATTYVVSAPNFVTAPAPQATFTAATPQGGFGTATAPQFTVNQGGQVYSFNVSAPAPNQALATALAQGIVGESVQSGEAPYLTRFVDSNGRGTIAGLIKAALRRFLGSFAGGGVDGNLLRSIGSILLDFFLGGSGGFDKNQAMPDLDSIINALLREKNGGGGGGSGGPSLQPGEYTVTFTGKLLIGPSNGGQKDGGQKDGGQKDGDGPAPANNGASDPSDRDQKGPSRAPF